MLVGGREGVAHFGLLDFQDALAGHPAYDLASVLEDARRDVPPDDRAGDDRSLSSRRPARPRRFERAYWALAAQRNTRILGVFTRLWKRDGKPGYRRFQPRMWGLLERDLAQPAAGAGARLVRRQHRARASPRAVAGAGVNQAKRALRLRAEVPARGAAHGDDHGGGPRQADAAADRDPAQAAGRGGGQGAARPCARPAARGGRRARSSSTSIISPTRSKRISRAASTGSRSSSPTSATCCSRPAAGWCRPRR